MIVYYKTWKHYMYIWNIPQPAIRMQLICFLYYETSIWSSVWTWYIILINLVESHPTACKPSASPLEPHPPLTEHQPVPVEPRLLAGADNNAFTVAKDGIIDVTVTVF